MDPSGFQPRILLADDDDHSRSVFTSFFKVAGWSYDLVTDGASALRAAAEQDYDVIVTDLVMPDVSGISLLRNLRQSKPLQPVIGVAEKSVDLQEAVDFLKEGASDFLLRPVDFDLLERAVRRVLSGVRKERFDGNLYMHVLAEECVVTFKTHEIADGRLNLTILDKLQTAGMIDANLKLKLVLAFQEALTNSIDHGNLELQSSWKEQTNSEGIDEYSRQRRARLLEPQYADRSITVSWSYIPGQLTIGIKDEGPGFLHAGQEASLDDTKAEVCHGRGLIILSSLLDQVLYSQGGTQVALVKSLPLPSEKPNESEGGTHGA